VTLEGIENFNKVIKTDKNVYDIVEILTLYMFLIFFIVLFQVI